MNRIELGEWHKAAFLGCFQENSRNESDNDSAEQQN